MALVMVLVTFAAVHGQTQFVNPNVQSNVTIEAGVSNDEGVNSFEGSLEIQKTLGSRFMLDNTIELSNGEETVVGNRALLRFYPHKNLFVAGGARVFRTINVDERRFDNDTALTPSFQLGLTLNANERLQFEPYIQVDSPDLLSNDPSRTLLGNVTVSYQLASNFGLVGDVGVGQTRIDNGFFQNGRAFKYAVGGVYFTF
jgi:hypothetical protein